jgi:energy-coupling factor transporter ATP-binding protein EcfA2
MPRQLSGGQSQRVVIARALANDSLLILADETTGNLDSAASVNVPEILKGLAHRYDRAVIVVTHDRDFAAAVDRVIVMSDGKTWEVAGLSLADWSARRHRHELASWPRVKAWRIEDVRVPASSTWLTRSSSVVPLNVSLIGRGRPDDTRERGAALGRVSRAPYELSAARNCTRDEGGPFEFGDQVPISSHRKLLWSKAMVVSVAETPGQDFGRYGRERRAQANCYRSVESGSGDVRTGG